MKNVLILAALLGLGAPLALQAADDHDHDHAHEEEEIGLDDFSGIEFDEEENHGHDHDHEEEGHGHEEEEGHGHGHGHGHGEEASEARLDGVQRRLAGVETMVVERGALGRAITAPGEVVFNAYRTTAVTPRIPAQVVERHVQLGDHVRQGQPLVTLSSVEMAEAQGGLMAADAERRRVERLGRQVVSEKRYIAAQIDYQQAYARVRAYGMTPKQIEKLIETGDASRATGRFRLLAGQGGTVVRDDFVVGELIEPGRELMRISDESLLWVEARLAPEDVARVRIGAPARIEVGGRWREGKVVRASHAFDETTRTLALHVEVANPDDSLHPGQFVSVVIEGDDPVEGLVVPVEAVLRSPDGDWQVFVESAPGRFEPREVEVIRTNGDRMVVEGIASGTTIVGKGAFFVQSEMAKGGFDPHNH